MDHWRDIFWASRSSDFLVLLEFVPGATASHALFGFRRGAWHTGFLLHREPMGWSARFELDGVLGFASSTLASVAVASSASAPSPWWSTSFFSRTASIVFTPTFDAFHQHPGHQSIRPVCMGCRHATYVLVRCGLLTLCYVPARILQRRHANSGFPLLLRSVVVGKRDVYSSQQGGSSGTTW